ncbi:antibiotic biosynthesis monooxygenase [Nocardioides anomalus]|uniref:Antibiotic biosynthesis monooxygenase n=1 Tax=Nocardioides anomalus TaxID=2712223 RepID=A0A6G6WEG9_9ACTN|nr:putative quinol monooxygenase [Nocardioides anomalus]QIG43741.1 antibiotic biosynthesis monooxygenase [Nocardioides anomalus]
MILATAYFHVRPGAADEFAAAAREVIARTTADEPGCVAYSCYREVLDEDQFVFVEEWQDLAAIGAHAQSEHFLAFDALARDLVDAQRVVLHTVEKSRTV